MLSAALLVLMVTGKPVCTKQSHGQMWPSIANEDKGALLSLAHSGTLEMCMASTWGYKWQHLTLNAQSKPR